VESGIYEEIKYFKRVGSETYQLLGWLGYKREDAFEFENGKWEIYTKRNFIFPYFVTNYSSPVNKFVAIYLSKENSIIVYGSFENIQKLKENLEIVTKTFFPVKKKLFFIPLTLVEENAQDYGYIRGVLLGIALFFIDTLYSWIFKLRYGIFTGFIDFIKNVYYGEPALAMGIGVLGTGLYFGFLLIFIPILLGNIYVKKEKKLREIKIKNLPDEIKEYEFGVKAERALKEEFEMIIEEKKKEKMYCEINKLSSISKTDFETLYFELNQGFLSAEGLLNFVNIYKDKLQNLPIEKFLEIISEYKKASIESEIKIIP